VPPLLPPPPKRRCDTAADSFGMTALSSRRRLRFHDQRQTTFIISLKRSDPDAPTG
jgi:hypothetical protein